MTHIKLKKEKIAIIGSGISGISAAYFLCDKYDISLYESKKYLGGHAITLDKEIEDQNSKLKRFFFDIGFLVYNEKNYPYFKNLLNQINVKTEKSNMSFSVSNRDKNYEYGSTGILSITNNLKNIFYKDFWSMIINIIKFYKISKKFLENKKTKDITLGSFIQKNQFSEVFIKNHIIPMCGAIWSTSSTDVLSMPTRYILKFLDNHGLLNLYHRPQWLTISNGSKTYVSELEKRIKGKVFRNQKVIGIERKKNKVLVHSKNFTKEYNKIILAVHGDDVLKLLKKPTKKEINVFSKYKYEKNTVLVHQDKRLMPKNKNVWSSWNVLNDNENSEIKKKICVTYWINKLQNLATKNPLLVTLNPPADKKIDKRKILEKVILKHPLLNENHLFLSEEVNNLQGNNMTYYTGAWLGYGFHEDGLKASIRIVKLLN